MSDKFVACLDNSVCSPILERLKILTMSDELNRAKAFQLLDNLEKSKLKSSKTIGDQSDILSLSDSELKSDALTHIGKDCIVAQSCSPLLKQDLIDFKNTDNSVLNDNPCSFQDYNKERIDNVKISGVNGNNFKSKREFLRKGQGLTRYNCKRFKGFKKYGDIMSKNSLPQKDMKLPNLLLVKSKPKESLSKDCTTVKVCKATSQKANYQMTRNLDAFEKLEELVEHDSFVSTSSKVNQLLFDDNSICSTPVAQRKSSFRSLNFTPIQKENKDNIFTQKNDEPQQTPVHNTFTNTKARLLFSNMTNELKEIIDYENTDHRKYKVIGINEKDSTKLYKSGILKHCLSPNYCGPQDRTNFSVPKVHFPNRGVNVLEFEKELEEANSATVCSEDSDLINISDLENLQLLGLNYNFEIVHEISSSKEGDFGNQISEKTRMNFQKSGQIFGSPKLQGKQHLNVSQTDTISTAFQNNVALQTNMKKPNSGNKISPLKHKETDNCVSRKVLKEAKGKNCKVENFSDDDIEVKKILLMSRAYELKKEINTFKVKNETLDKLIEELKCEKEKLVILQTKEERKSCMRKKLNSRPVGPKDCTSLENGVIISTKIQKLNEKLCRLETENNNLKRKVNSLENKEKELKKTQNEILSHSRNPSFTKKVPGILNKDKNLSMKKVGFRTDSEATSNKVSATQKSNFEESTGTVQNLTKVDVEEIELNNFKDVASLGSCESNLIVTGQCPTTDQSDDIILNMNKFCDNAKEFSISQLSNTDSQYSKPDKVTAFPFDIDELDNGTKILSINQHPNGDVETNYAEKVVYWYSKDQITHTRFRGGKEIIEFKNGQKEIYFPDGSHQISFPDKSCTTVYRDGTQKTISCDGTRTHINKDGTKVVLFPNGQKEVYLQESVQRIYPDGTVKILHKNGTQETRYRNGRMRIKDKDGNIIMK